MRRLVSVLGVGLVAAGVVGLYEVAARGIAGLPLPSELFSDWYLPTLPVNTFLSDLGRLGGPTTAKALAFWGTFGFIVIVAVVASAGWEWLRGRRWGGRAALVIVLIVAVAVVAWLRPVLVASYAGLPPRRAALATAGGLVVALVLLAYSIRVMRPPPRFDPGRRGVLAAGSGLLLLAVTGGLASRLFRDGTFSYDGTRLLGPTRITVTPVPDFYVVTKNLIDPNVNTSLWHLDITGMVAAPYTLDIDQLRALSAQTQQTTLECISNGVGYGLMSNGIWTGPQLRTLIQRAKPAATAQFVELQSVDGYIYTLPLNKALRSDVIVAHSMNAQPLTRRHGAPARAIVPGDYGEASAKWLTRVSLLAQPVQGYYERQGWQAGYIHTTSVIDQPTSTSVLRVAQRVAIAGVAFAGDRGVSAVEVSTDGGQRWSPARIIYAPSPLAWTLWSAAWTPPRRGPVTLAVRAYDGAGTPQEATPHGFAPAGATGLFRVQVQVV
jgi:DMSO/TMAO reductase YedYZ molybdopterin-dependent catalytic subunit